MLILVEGMDFSGKTLFCKYLVAYICGHGVKAKYNPGPMLHGPTRFLAELATSNVITWEWYRNISYLLAFYADTLLYRSPREIYIIQETYIDRSLAYAQVNRTIMQKPLKVVRCLGDRFDATVYLRADWNTRISRYQAQKKVHLPDEIRFSNKNSFLDWEMQLERLVCMRKNVVIIDTDEKDPENILGEAILALKSYIGGVFLLYNGFRGEEH